MSQHPRMYVTPVARLKIMSCYDCPFKKKTASYSRGGWAKSYKCLRVEKPKVASDGHRSGAYTEQMDITPNVESRFMHGDCPLPIWVDVSKAPYPEPRPDERKIDRTAKAEELASPFTDDNNPPIEDTQIVEDFYG